MNDFLITHALQNVWCDPEQDFQHIFQPQKISRPDGVVGSCTVLWTPIFLPTPSDTYHVYQIGQMAPPALGLIASVGAWTSLANVMAQKLVYIQVYTGTGLLFPLAESYIMQTKDRTLILAVKAQPTLPSLKVTPLYFRFYSNAFFASKRSYGQTNTVVSQFYRHSTVVNGLAFQHLYTQYQAMPGFCSLMLNGTYIDSFIPMNLTVGDVLEFVYDSTIKKVVDFPISALPTFDSVKDAKFKYLLHYAGPQATPEGTNASSQTIDYRDDCDVYLFLPRTNPNGSAGFAGIYFHKNQNDAFRQVTHRDYSVAVPYVAAYQTSQPTWTDISNLTIRLVIRNAGFDRPLINEANRIKELYKLNELDLNNAFLGIDSTVSCWRAPVLENSDYVNLMDDERWQVSQAQVESAYGYNAIASLIAPSPALMNGNAWIDLPPGLWSDATMYEYDANGVLLGWYPHVLGVQYSPVFTGCQLVEGRMGTASSALPQVMGQNAVPVVPGVSYRFYIASISNGQVMNNTWQDVTGDNTKYMIVNGQVQWLVNASAYQTCVKSDQGFLAYDLTMSPANGLLKFSIQGTSSYPTGQINEVLQIPVGSLELWLNGRALIENIDYYVTWPQVVIINKMFLVDGPIQQITVRGSGFCNSDLSRPSPDETSFLRWGVLSHNDVFNIRDDKVLRIVADGRVFDRSQVIFAEDATSASLPAVPNGSPYVVSDVIVPLRQFTQQDTYTMLPVSQAIDAELSAYMSLKLPDTDPPVVDIIPDLYSVYSPFTSVIIHDMVNGILSMANFEGQYSDKDVKDYLAPYTYLLAFDPTQRGVDTTHVAIHPHNEMVVINLSIYQYNFLARAVHLFLNDQVDLSKFLAIVWY